jgi:hypothetical protein
MNKKAIVLVSKSPKKNILSYYEKRFTNEKLISVSPQIPNFKLRSRFQFFTDDDFLSKDEFFAKYTIDRQGWYYQQFLKYEIVLKLDYNYIHIIDGDSKLNFKHVFSHDVRKTPIKVNKCYNNFLSSITNEHSISITKENFITNEMSFSKIELERLLEHLNFRSGNYIDGFINKLSNDSWFSEYQLYALYKINQLNVSKKNIKVFRRLDLIPKIVIQIFPWQNRYDLIAYEGHHKSGFLRRLRAILLYTLSRNLG